MTISFMRWLQETSRSLMYDAGSGLTVWVQLSSHSRWGVLQGSLMFIAGWVVQHRLAIRSADC